MAVSGGPGMPGPYGVVWRGEDERGKGGRQPSPFAVGGGCPGMDGDARPVGIPQSPNGDSPL